jgi:predicted RND superfamily exporter protein
MGLLGIPLDFMTMTIMPMLLGLTVDDTMHVIIHAQMEYKKSRNLRQALLDTTKTVGKAIIMTSSILGLSFLVYITSKINVFVYLGVFTFVGILSGVLADFLITPLLVVWTKPFKNKTTKNSGK